MVHSRREPVTPLGGMLPAKFACQARPQLQQEMDQCCCQWGEEDPTLSMVLGGGFLRPTMLSNAGPMVLLSRPSLVDARRWLAALAEASWCLGTGACVAQGGGLGTMPLLAWCKLDRDWDSQALIARAHSRLLISTS